MSSRSVLLGLVLIAGACTPARQQRVIEPVAPVTPSPSSGKSESDFTLSKQTTRSEPATPADYPVHLADKWFPFRAEYLGMSAAEAAARDDSISEVEAPQKVWDEQLAIEAV